MAAVKDVREVSPYRHIIASQQFSETYLRELFDQADSYRQWDEERLKRKDRTKFCLNDLRGWNVFVGLYESSTRTRTSFTFAAKNLSARVEDSENLGEFSSVSKGESLEHTVRALGCFCDILVERFKKEGDAEKAVRVAEQIEEQTGKKISIINAGDGTGQHPTQALLDVYTIKDHFFKLDNLKIAMIGDLAKGRTVHSLTYLFSKYSGNEFYFVSHENSQMPRNILVHLDENGIKYNITPELNDVLRIVDVVYMTRTQKERFKLPDGSFDEEGFKEACGKYRISNKNIALMPKQSILMHPLPIDSIEGKEILPEVDSNPRAFYFKEMQNGLYVRMAILKLIRDHYGQPTI
ncbi:MAG TPA: aspartate carbamoyltransferase [Candidatus Nanoarchaeia archaeon]|nr:aspartate carbamoyltransferase [Candidatus Nanoarchaeia archaeon]